MDDDGVVKYDYDGDGEHTEFDKFEKETMNYFDFVQIKDYHKLYYCIDRLVLSCKITKDDCEELSKYTKMTVNTDVYKYYFADQLEKCPPQPVDCDPNGYL